MNRLIFQGTRLLAATALAFSFATAAQPSGNIPEARHGFTPNMGQWPQEILFQSDAGSVRLWFTRGGVYYQFLRESEPSTAAADFPNTHGTIETMMIKATFVGANPDPTVVPLASTGYVRNYFVGNDPARWRTRVPTYRSFTLEEVYPGVDVRFECDANGQLVYGYTASSEADLASVSIACEGGTEVVSPLDGQLAIMTPWSDTVRLLGADEPRPDRAHTLFRRASRQESERPSSRTGFAAGGPSAVTMAYSTYLGGTAFDYSSGVAVDAGGLAVIVGYTVSTDFPTVNPYQTDQLNSDVFIAALSSSGDSLLFSTYLGGDSTDNGLAIALGAAGDIYLTGSTISSDFPTQNAYQTDQASTDGFVTRFSSSGDSLIYSTYLGGNGSDGCGGIAVDASGNAYVTGSTASTNFPVLNQIHADQVGSGVDVFVTKLANTGSSLVYSTYLGGNDLDQGFAIAIDTAGSAYITGRTLSTDFETQNPFQGNQADYDAFVAKLAPAGNSLIYSTYLGGGGVELANGIAVDSSGSAYVAGYTNSTNFPTKFPVQTDPDGVQDDFFVTRLAATGDSLIYSTYLGGSGGEYGHAIAVDAAGNAYVTGDGYSNNYPTAEPFQTYQGAFGLRDVMVTKLPPSGSPLTYSTYLAGTDNDWAYAIAVDAEGNAYVAGRTTSTDFPLSNPYQVAIAGDYDLFVTKLNSSIATGIDDEPASRPDDYQLIRNYPNPFNPSTRIEFALTQPARVQLDIFNVRGQRVTTVLDGPLGAGSQTLTWDGRNAEGSPVASGVYLYRLVVDGQVSARKMLLLR
jgi:hypothetical protein